MSSPAVDRTSEGPAVQGPLSYVLAGLGLLVAAVVGILLFNSYHFTHNRTRNFVARDFAAAVLQGLEKNAILFTNGDNDTFPLWYLQYVEGVRTDVRVVNLSLLNTPWYVKQVTTLEPKVAITLTDAQINDLQAFRDPQSGRIVMPKDIAVQSIIQATGDKKPVYFAFSVPDAQDWAGRTIRTTFAYRVMPHPVPDSLALDRAGMERELATLKIRGMLDENGNLDPSVYRDDITYGFLQNGIAMAHFDLGAEARRQGDLDASVRHILHASRLAPSLPFFIVWAGRSMEEQGKWAQAESLYKASAAKYPDMYEYPWRLGMLYLQQGKTAEGHAQLQLSASKQNATFDPVQDLVSDLVRHNDPAKAAEVVSTWLTAHPADTTAQKYLSLLGGAGAMGGQAAPPTP